jgi:hypothetical protein
MSSQAILSVVGSIITGIFSGLFVAYKSNIFTALPEGIISILILIFVPLFCYLISIIMSLIHQFQKCGTVDIKGISVSNSAVLGTTGILSSFLYFESIPFLKYIFGVYAPRNEITGEYIVEGTPAYTEAMLNEKHYKIQFFSNIVKSVLPVYLIESVKDGFAYTYWIFWMTMLPLYFLLSLQGVCA